MTHSQETPDQSQKAEPLPETREPLKAYQRLSEKIQDAIEKGGLKVGDKLPPERALAETFGVSRNSVREAPSARSRSRASSRAATATGRTSAVPISRR